MFNRQHLHSTKCDLKRNNRFRSFFNNYRSLYTYERIKNVFKNELLDRKLNRNILISFVALLVIYVISYVVLWSIFKHWAIMLSTILIFIVLFLITAYSIMFFTVKKNINLNIKDYFHPKQTLNLLKSISKKDVQILLPIAKSHGINTRPKVQEAIRHYQLLLLRKSNKGFAIISIISLTLSIFSIIISGINYESDKDFIILIVWLFSLVILVTLACIGVKFLYRTTFYDLSDYVLYERIEEALSEIWMNKLI